MEKIAALEAQLSDTQRKLREVEGQIQSYKDKVVEAQQASERVIREYKELNAKLEREF